MSAFLERDIGQLGITIPAATLDRFWSMLAHCHAQIWNGSELARAFAVSHHTVRRYLDALESTFMVRSLKPWSANLGKRQVKSPKVYVRDSGLLHRLLDVASQQALERHPQVGASREGFVIENAIRTLGVEDRQCYFWAAHAGALRSAVADLRLERLDVIHAGTGTFPLARGVRAVAAGRMLEDLP